LGWGAFLLAGILGSTAAGEPFHPANPRRWSLLGIAILLASVGSDVINYAASNAFVNFYGVHDNLLVTSPYLSFVPPVIAFTAFLVAGAFAAGRRSQQELQGLV
jgi:hypothetical protein